MTYAPALAVPTDQNEVATNPHLLLVEDDADVREMYGYGLRQHGMVVSTAADLFIARKLLSVERFEAAVLDWWLPGASGLELCRLIRSTPATAHIPVIVVTANNHLLADSPVCEGVTAVLHKPLSPLGLAAAVRAALAG